MRVAISRWGGGERSPPASQPATLPWGEGGSAAEPEAVSGECSRSPQHSPLTTVWQTPTGAHTRRVPARERGQDSARQGWVGLVTVGTFRWVSPCPSVGWGGGVWSFVADGDSVPFEPWPASSVRVFAQ